MFAAELSATASTAFGAANVEVGPKLKMGFEASPVPVAAEGGENNGCDVGARGADAAKLKADVGGCEGVVEATSVLPLAFFASPFAVPNPNAAEVDRGFAAKENVAGEPGVPGVPGAPVVVAVAAEPMLKENVGNGPGVVEAAADGVDGALNRKEDPPDAGGDGITIVSPIAGFTLGLSANILDVFWEADGVAGGSFSAAFSLACSSITFCAKMLARLEERLSVVDSVVLFEGTAAPNAGTGTDDVLEADAGADTGVGAASFFSTGCPGPKLKPAKGEALAGAFVEGRLGLKPPVAGLAVSEVVEVAAGSLNPPTAGKAGLNPFATVDDVDVDGAGSLNPPVLATGGAGMAKAGWGASVAFLLGGASLEESSIAVASRFLAWVPFAVTAFPAFFMISSK